MAVRILHKRSAVEFKSATGAQLEFGELGLNYHESGPYLQCKDAAGEVVQLGGVYIGDSAPGNELKGAWWLRSADETLFLYDGTKWVSIAGGGGGGGGTTTVIGGDGIEAVLSSADTYTVSVDLATNSNGLSIVGGKLTADIATTSSLGTVKIGDGIDVGADGEISVDLSGVDVNADLEYVPNGNNAATITNTAGDDATVPIATDSVAGLFTGDEKQKLAGIEDGAAANQDLGYTADGNNAGTVTITDGTDATVPIVTDTVAGLMTGTQKQKLDGIEAGAQVNDGYSQAESDDRYLRIDAGAPDQTRVSGEATFAELTTHAGGVSVTGSGSVQYGLNNISDVLQLRYESQPLVQLRKGGVDDYRVRFTARQQVDYTPVNDSPVFSILPTINGQSTWNTDIFTVKPTLTGAFNSLIGLNLDFKEGIASGTAITANNFYGMKLGRTNQITPGTGKLYGIYTEVEGSNNYNFYAEGDAPNYFAGNITCDGLINGAFSLRMETDDPVAFQTTYTTETDEEGNEVQVENQEYIGTTEDLLSIIKDLRARVAALEAAQP